MMKTLFSSKLLLVLGLLILGSTTNAQVLDWANSIGGEKTDDNRSIAVDKEGNVYVAGTFYGTADFNPGAAVDTLSIAGGSDAFLAKYDADGNYLWAISMGGTAYDYGKSVAVDEAGNAYVTGYFVNKAGFNPAGGDTLHAGTGFQDAFVAKYDPDGKYLWAINMGGSNMNYGIGITVSKKGNVYVTGAFGGTTDFDPGKDTAKLTAQPGSFFGGNMDVFMAKYDADGKYLWAKGMGCSGADDYGYGIAVDGSENAYLTGYFANTADFNPDPNNTNNLIAMGINDVFVAKYDVDGKYLWAESMGSKADDNGLGIALDKANNVYVTGYFSDTAVFDPLGSAADTLISRGKYSYDAFIAKYDSSGKHIWANNLGGSAGDDVGYGIAMDRVGNVYVTGYFKDSADFGGADLLKAVAGSQDIFLAKYDPAGNYMWAGSIGGDKSDYGYSITCDQSGNTYATGYYNGKADLDPGTKTADFTSAGSSDVFLLKLICDDTSSSQVAVTSCDKSYTWYDSAYTAGGTYTHVLPNAAGCDSTIVLDLTFSKITTPVITTDEFTLGVSGTYDTYQWIKDGTPIPGATSDKYKVTENGTYRVAVTNEDGCADTSAGYEINNYTGIGTVASLAQQIHVYPNPATDAIYVQSPVAVKITLTDIEGRVIQKAQATRISLKDFTDGLYLLRISDLKGTVIKVEKIVKQSK